MMPEIESPIPRQYSLVNFDFSAMPLKYHKAYPFTENGAYVFLGEIPNMLGHCIVVDHVTGQIYSGDHTENFIEVKEDDG